MSHGHAHLGGRNLAVSDKGEDDDGDVDDDCSHKRLAERFTSAEALT